MVGAPSHPSLNLIALAYWDAVASKKQWRKKKTYDFHKIHSVFLNAAFFLMFFKIFNMLNFDPKQAGWLSFKKLVWIILFISLTMFLKQGKIEQKLINVFF